VVFGEVLAPRSSTEALELSPVNAEEHKLGFCTQRQHSTPWICFKPPSDFTASCNHAT
jgi:hypothetical protein